MGNTKAGGKKVAITNKLKYGDDYYVKMGQLGGRKKVPKGFARMDKEKVRAAGKLGGTRSKRGSKEY